MAVRGVFVPLGEVSVEGDLFTLPPGSSSATPPSSGPAVSNEPPYDASASATGASPDPVPAPAMDSPLLFSGNIGGETHSPGAPDPVHGASTVNLPTNGQAPDRQPCPLCNRPQCGLSPWPHINNVHILGAGTWPSLEYLHQYNQLLCATCGAAHSSRFAPCPRSRGAGHGRCDGRLRPPAEVLEVPLPAPDNICHRVQIRLCTEQWV